MLLELLLASLLVGRSTPACLEVADADKRSYDDLRPIPVQLVPGGPVSSVVPRVYVTRAPKRGTKPARETHWIAFDLRRADGSVRKSFYRFNYGDNVADYWVYALVPCDVNQDGRTDLVFYAGDDTGDDIVVLMNRNGRFRPSAAERARSSQ